MILILKYFSRSLLFLLYKIAIVSQQILYVGQRMLVCVLKHTPGVFGISTDQNETHYSGLEVEVLHCLSNDQLKVN